MWQDIKRTRSKTPKGGKTRPKMPSGWKGLFGILNRRNEITMTTKRKATGVPKNTFRSAYNLGNEDYSETLMTVSRNNITRISVILIRY